MKLPAAGKEVPAGEVAADWTKQPRVGSLETPAVDTGRIELVAVSHQHRLEARAAGDVLWAFVADGRISSGPVLLGDVAVFGDHAGWVYAVALKDGSQRWKHLVAPTHRLIGNNGQLESAWPVYGVAVMDGQIIASAGTHVGTGGGVWVTSLHPISGKAAWRKRIFLPPNAVPAGGKGARIVAHTFLNSVPRIDKGQIVLGDGGRQGGQFRFSPTATESDVPFSRPRPKTP